MNIQKFEFNDVEIEFDFRQGKNMMVNATEMAKVFGKDLYQFTKSADANSFIESCLKPAFAGLLGVKTVDDLIISKQKSGTWMHRVLALKFAAWLNPDFDVWVYLTIDNLLYEYAHEIEDSISETVRLQHEQDLLSNKMAKESPEFLTYLTNQQKLFESKNRRRKATMNKFKSTSVDLFSQLNKEE